MDDFYNTAVMLIYPNGNIDRLKISDDILHMIYFAKLYKISSQFKKIVINNNLNFCDEYGNANNLFTYQLDLGLAKNDVIAIHNLNIQEIQRNSNYLKKSIPKFVITIPRTLSEGQQKRLKEIFNDNDLYKSEFLFYTDNNFMFIDYEDVYNLVYSKTY